MPIYCDNCGHQNGDSSEFCQGCGGNIEATTPSGILKPEVLVEYKLEEYEHYNRVPCINNINIIPLEYSMEKDEKSKEHFKLRLPGSDIKISNSLPPWLRYSMKSDDSGKDNAHTIISVSIKENILSAPDIYLTKLELDDTKIYFYLKAVHRDCLKIQEEKRKEERKKIEEERLKAERKKEDERKRLEEERLKAERKKEDERRRLEEERLKAERKKENERKRLEEERLEAERKKEDEKKRLEEESANRRSARKVALITVPLIFFSLAIVAFLVGNTYFNPASYNAIAKKEAGKGNFQEAIKDYEKALKLDDKNIEALLGIASANNFMGNIPKAEEKYRLALKINPANTNAHRGLYELYMNKKDYDSAGKELDDLLKIEKNTSNLLNNYLDLGKKFFEQKKFNLALECYEKANSIEPQNTDALLGAGEAAYNNKQFDKSRGYYEKMIKKCPGDPVPLIRLAETCMKENNYSLALEYIENVKPKVKGDKNRTYYINQLAVTCYVETGKYKIENGKVDDAQKNFKSALNIDKSNTEAKKGLAGCYIKTGKSLFDNKKYAEAKDSFNKVIAMNAGEQSVKDATDYLNKIENILAPSALATYSYPSYSGYQGGGNSNPPPANYRDDSDIHYTY